MCVSSKRSMKRQSDRSVPYHTTTSLMNIATVLQSFRELQPGDAINSPGSHVRLVEAVDEETVRSECPVPHHYVVDEYCDSSAEFPGVATWRRYQLSGIPCASRRSGR